MRGNRSAIILAAGHGSRLRSVAPSKPLVRVRGKPLLHHSIDRLQTLGIGEITVVVGHMAGAVAASFAGRSGVRAVLAPQWATTPNGVSLLAARAAIGTETLLLMADHLVSEALLQRLLQAPPAPLVLAVDRRLGHPAIDEADVTRVRTDGTRIRGIGKGLLVYDCYDTGVFRISPAFGNALAGLADPSLSDAVRLLSRDGLAQAADIGDAAWIDVDDPRALALAEAMWDF